MINKNNNEKVLNFSFSAIVNSNDVFLVVYLLWQEKNDKETMMMWCLESTNFGPSRLKEVRSPSWRADFRL